MDGYRFPALGVGDYAVIAALILVVIALLYWRRTAKRTARIRKIIRTHLKTLLLKKQRGLSRDDYGNIVDSGWAKEIGYFYNNVIPETLRQSKDLTAVSALMEKEIGRLPKKTVNQWTMADRHSVATGDDFERFVKGELEDKGWSVRHTGKSGDQGGDLIAEKDGFSVAVQCKLSAKPVGNKAVQEVLAAQRYYATHGGGRLERCLYQGGHLTGPVGQRRACAHLGPRPDRQTCRGRLGMGRKPTRALTGATLRDGPSGLLRVR